MNANFSTTSVSTPSEVAFLLGLTISNEIDLGPLLAQHWRARHILRLSGGTRYWRRRRVPRWVQRVEAAGGISKTLRELEEVQTDADRSPI